MPYTPTTLLAILGSILGVLSPLEFGIVVAAAIAVDFVQQISDTCLRL